MALFRTSSKSESQKIRSCWLAALLSNTCVPFRDSNLNICVLQFGICFDTLWDTVLIWFQNIVVIFLYFCYGYGFVMFLWSKKEPAFLSLFCFGCFVLQPFASPSLVRFLECETHASKGRQRGQVNANPFQVPKMPTVFQRVTKSVTLVSTSKQVNKHT